MSPRARRTIAWATLAIVHLALLGLCYWPEQRALFGDEGMYLRAAESVIEHGRSGLGSFWPPAYAWFLAPLLAATGGALWLAQLVQIGLLVLAAWLLRQLIKREFEDPRMADVGAGLMLAFPPLVAFAHYLWPEILHLALMLGAVSLLLRRGPRLWAVAVAGGLLAACLQTKVLLLPLLVPLVVGLWRRWPAGRRAAAVATLVATIGLGVLPTVLAQQRDFGRAMLADSGWFNLWIGLNEASRLEFVDSIVVEEYPRYMQSARSAGGRVAIVRGKIDALIEDRGLGPILRRQLGRQYHRLFSRESFLTHQLAGGELWRQGAGYRAGDSVVAQAVRWSSYASWGAVLALAAFGVALFPYGRWPLGGWILGFLLAQCALYLVLHVKSRYMIQMLPGVFFFAAYAAVWWRRRGSLESGTRPSAPRFVAGSVLAGVLLYLAFSGG